MRKLHAREPGDPTGSLPGWRGWTDREGQKPYGGHERLWEVGCPHSTKEAAEQGQGKPVCGGGGAKAGNQGKRGTAGHAPDPEPEKYVARTATRANSSAKGQGCTVHFAFAPCHRYPAKGQLPGLEKTGRCWRGRRYMVRVPRESGSKTGKPAQQGA